MRTPIGSRWLPRLAAALVAVPVLALAVPAGAAPAASAAPVQCAAGDPSPDGRVFPEPRVSATLVTYAEGTCGLRLLETKFPGRVQVTEIGRSKGNLPVLDVLVTDEAMPTFQGKPKQKLLIVSSIHGNEPGGREGGLRYLEDIVDPRFDANEPYVTAALTRYVVHFLFANPDGWANGDVTFQGGVQATRGNDNNTDLNRNFPVQGFISAANKTLQEPESQAIDALLAPGGWDLGTDNHGQGADTFGAAGLQIVGQFDFRKSETLARYADAITLAFQQVGGLAEAQVIADATGIDAGAYHWGTLFDMLGYSASGSLIDYYNTAGGLDGSGYATELTAGQHVNSASFSQALTQVWVDAIRAINSTMLKQAPLERGFTFPVGTRTAYVDDPAVVTDGDGEGYVRKAGETLPQRPYTASRMRFLRDLSAQASQPLTPLRVPAVLADPGLLDAYDSLVLADNPMPEGAAADAPRWYALLRAWVERGGNLVVTDAAATALAGLGVVPASSLAVSKGPVGYVDFSDRTQPLNQGLRGVARQTYDIVPIGYAFGASGNTAPNWTVATSAWSAAGGRTAGTNGTGRTVYGEVPLGAGQVRFLGALLPQPTEGFYHPYGLQNYAVTYTGYTLLQNMLAGEPGPNPVVPEAPVAALLPVVALALVGGAAVGARRRRRS